jgi:hypothetical protein
MPPRYIPALLSYHQLVIDCVDFNDQLRVLYAMQSDTWRAWRRTIERADPQETIDAYEKAHKSIRRRTTWIYGKLHKAKMERMARDLNQQKLLEQNAAHLRATQGENGARP